MSVCVLKRENRNGVEWVGGVDGGELWSVYNLWIKNLFSIKENRKHIANFTKSS